MELLLVDTDLEQAAQTKLLLRQHGFRMRVAGSAEAAISLLSKKQFDGVVLHFQTGSSPLSEVLEFLTYTQTLTPSMVLLQAADVLSRIAVLKMGAHDCLSCPYHPEELGIRLKRRMDAIQATSRQVLTTDLFSLDVSAGHISCPWGEVTLRRKEMLILGLLMKHHHSFVSKEAMINTVWGMEETPTLSTIDVHIRRLRVKLRDDHKSIIKTNYGVGYMFCG